MKFEVATGDNHHHLVCRTCGTVTDVPCAVGSVDAGGVPDELEVRSPMGDLSQPRQCPSGHLRHSRSATPQLHFHHGWIRFPTIPHLKE